MRKLNYNVFCILIFTSVTGINASECYVHKLTVAKHIDANISTESIDKALSDASDLLKLKATERDYSCCVRLVREGSVGTFGSTGDNLNNINNSSDLRKVWHLSNHKIKVVKSLKLPAHLGVFGDIEPKSGQAYPGLTMVNTQDASPAVWAHEFGHYKHIWLHRDDSVDNLMNSIASETGVLSKSDCELMQADGIEDTAPPNPPSQVTIH